MKTFSWKMCAEYNPHPRLKTIPNFNWTIILCAKTDAYRVQKQVVCTCVVYNELPSNSLRYSNYWVNKGIFNRNERKKKKMFSVIRLLLKCRAFPFINFLVPLDLRDQFTEREEYCSMDGNKVPNSIFWLHVVCMRISPGRSQLHYLARHSQYNTEIIWK